MKSAVLPDSFAFPSAIAHLAVRKYVMYSPLYRLEKEYERQGLKLSRSEGELSSRQEKHLWSPMSN